MIYLIPISMISALFFLKFALNAESSGEFIGSLFAAYVQVLIVVKFLTSPNEEQRE